MLQRVALQTVALPEEGVKSLSMGRPSFKLSAGRNARKTALSESSRRPESVAPPSAPRHRFVNHTGYKQAKGHILLTVFLVKLPTVSGAIQLPMLF